MNLRRPLIVAFAMAASTMLAAEPEVDSKDLPRFPAVEPKDAIQSIAIKKGFHLELAANEPLVVDPIAMAFDENGRLFVVEMRDYSERRAERLGRIRMLEDTNDDGIFDKETIYADDLAWPTAVICYDGGIFVGSTPDIYYFKDTDGDGKADVKKTLFTGFGNTRDRLNVQALMNGFNWGFDNRIHGLTAPNGGIVTNLAVTSQAPLDLQAHNFAIDPRTSLMTPESGGGQYGMSFNTHGRKFTCSNSDHLRLFMYEDRYAARNPLYAMPPSSVSIAVDGPAAEVFRRSPEEPWRVMRTKWRVTGVVPGMIEGGGRASGYFTGATGATIYKGDAFPEGFLDNAFTCDAGGNLVHRKLVAPDGVSMKAMRPADEQTNEFFAANDTWMRPVLCANGPDGCFYVIDMYREIIEHPWSLPENIKKHFDLNSGSDRGRIYRIVPDGFKRPATPQLGKATTKELVQTLEHPNGWHRETAARLIYEHQDKAAAPLLVKLLAKSKSAYGRLHALHALEGLGALTEANVLTALNDNDETVREHAILLSEKFIPSGKPSKALWTALKNHTGDSSMTVRYQLAFTLGEIKQPEKVAALAEIIRKDAANEYVRAAAFSSLFEGAGEMFDLVSHDAAFIGSAAGREFIHQLTRLVGAKNEASSVASVAKFLTATSDAATMFSLSQALGDGLKQASSSLQKAGVDIKLMLAKARTTATDATQEPSVRVQAIQLLHQGTYTDSGEMLASLIDSHQPQEIQVAALKTFGSFNDAKAGPVLTAHWRNLSPRLRSEALSILTSRNENITALLDAVQTGTIKSSEVPSPQIKLLKNNKNKDLASRATKLFDAGAQGRTRQTIVDSLQSALSLKGDAMRGKKVYEERCLSCHRLAGEGNALGPDLVTVKNSGKEKILVNILDPNREVAPQFMAYEIETKDDESHLGLITSETAASVTLKQAFGVETVILRSNIKKMQSQGQSLMPEGLEVGLDAQGFADLLEFITTAPK